MVLDDSDEEGEEEDMDRPGIYVLTGGNTWIQTGGRLGCTASREDQYDLFPEDVEVAAPPAWLQNMPVRLTRPWYSTWSTAKWSMLSSIRCGVPMTSSWRSKAPPCSAASGVGM